MDENSGRKRIKRTDYSILFIILFIFFNRVDATPQVYSDKIIVDNFENPGKKNLLGGDFGAFGDEKNLGRCHLFFVENRQKDSLSENRYSLYIQWDTTKTGAYGGYWTDLKHLHLENFNYLTLFLRGIKGGEIFKVGLRGKLNATYEDKIPINEVLSKGVTTEWQKVILPLKQFRAIQDWRDVNILSFNFENAFGSDKGALLIDDIIFEK